MVTMAVALLDVLKVVVAIWGLACLVVGCSVVIIIAVCVVWDIGRWVIRRAFGGYQW